MSDYLGMTARLVKQNHRLPPLGSLRVVTSSELADSAQLYHIEFDTVTPTGPLPQPGLLELLDHHRPV